MARNIRQGKIRPCFPGSGDGTRAVRWRTRMVAIDEAQSGTISREARMDARLPVLVHDRRAAPVVAQPVDHRGAGAERGRGDDRRDTGPPPCTATAAARAGRRRPMEMPPQGCPEYRASRRPDQSHRTASLSLRSLCLLFLVRRRTRGLRPVHDATGMASQVPPGQTAQQRRTLSGTSHRCNHREPKCGPRKQQKKKRLPIKLASADGFRRSARIVIAHVIHFAPRRDIPLN